jgi:hypothetical protein
VNVVTYCSFFLKKAIASERLAICPFPRTYMDVTPRFLRKDGEETYLSGFTRTTRHLRSCARCLIGVQLVAMGAKMHYSKAICLGIDRDEQIQVSMVYFLSIQTLPTIHVMSVHYFNTARTWSALHEVHSRNGAQKTYRRCGEPSGLHCELSFGWRALRFTFRTSSSS